MCDGQDISKLYRIDEILPRADWDPRGRHKGGTGRAVGLSANNVLASSILEFVVGTFENRKTSLILMRVAANAQYVRSISTRYETTPVRYVHQYLARLGKVGVTEKAFKEKMYELWFEPYTRDAKNDSSGFEHVFMGEEVR